VPVTTRNLIDAFIAELLNLKRIWLEGVPITIFRHQLDYTATVAKLAHFPGAPSVKVALLVCVFTIVLKVKVEIVIAIVRQQCDVLDTVALGSTRHIHARIKITINRTV